MSGSGLRKLRAEARRERAAEAAELRARGIARHDTELRWLLAGLRAEPWDVVMAQLRERAERLASEAPFLAPQAGATGYCFCAPAAPRAYCPGLKAAHLWGAFHPDQADPERVDAGPERAPPARARLAD
jgi:hypothetical protein